ncbi:hypothetical protein CHS0354_020445 [Potamilus streckersoni]|nr:hypothetical protein CHS0354_020445 [Potamilus streckersoni]
MARTENMPVTPKNRTPSTKQREMRLPLSRYGVNHQKLKNSEVGYIGHSNFQEHASLKLSPKGSDGHDLATYSSKKKSAENIAQFHSNENTRNREHFATEEEKHHFAYYVNNPYRDDQFNKSEKANKISDHSHLKPNNRSYDHEPPKNAYSNNKWRQNDNSEEDKKNVRRISSETTIPLSFQTVNRHRTVNQSSVRHGRSYDSERKQESERRTYVNSDVESNRYKDTQNKRSEEASLLLRQGNPNIADLSDVNRPTNISERFSELYSNEYTDTFEFLQKQGLSEQSIVYHLLRIVRYAYVHCRKRASDELSKKRRIVQGERIATYEFITGEKEERIIKGIAAKRLKIDALALTKDVCDTFMKEYIRLVPNGINPHNKHLLTYTLNCVEIMWFMSVQDPPIVISCVKEGDRFDVSLYRAYTKSGTIVDFCVWPLVLLAENGPILSKGVAQGR